MSVERSDVIVTAIGVTMALIAGLFYVSVFAGY